MATHQHTVYERARLARDARFDGQFFIGVRTTGIYCRPICPANSPKSENVTFFPSAAAASEAGYRPCLRCRPETAPGSPAWSGTSTTVRRGLRLIAAGALDDGNVEALSDRLGVTSRHLRRLFAQHLGASPLAVAHTQRLHFAKRLIDETRMPMGDISIAAGYGSVRRFNDAFRKSYGRSPRELRRFTDGDDPDASATLTVRLPYRQPFDWLHATSFFAARATPGVESAEGDCYRRSVVIDGEPGALEVRPASKAGFLSLTLIGVRTTSIFEVVQRARDLFDLDAPVGEIARVLRADPKLKAALKTLPGVRVPGAWDGFELTVRAILGQQVSVAAATTLAGRIAGRYGTPLVLENDRSVPGVTTVFPSPERLARARFNNIGLVKTRAETIRTLSRKVISGEISFDLSQDVDEFRERLCAIKGIGDWTAQYVAMRALKNPDAFPASDLGRRTRPT
ncbi:MAG: AlkA N-terminal domain-containing protein [Pseudomonadota bacterium]